MVTGRWSGNVGGLVVAVGVLLASMTPPLAAQDVGCRIQGAQTAAASNYYQDLGSIYQPFVPFIYTVTNAGIINPCGPRQFCPSDLVRREEMAFFLENGRRRGSPGWQLQPAYGQFSDVPTDYPLGCWIGQFFKDGITRGCWSDGAPKYCPANPVTRAEMAVLVCAAAGLPPASPVQHLFSDCGDPFAWAEPSIEAIFIAGITAGCGTNLFCPDENTPRDQLAVWLSTAFNVDCSFTISPTSRTIVRTGGTGTVAITTTSTCAWRAFFVNQATWVSITAGSSGTGSGQVDYSVQANNTGSTRTAELLIGWNVFTITQSGT